MSIKDIYHSMDYGPAPESAAEALAWLVDQGGRFGHYIGGEFTDAGDGFTARNPATGKTGEVLATLTQGTSADVDAAVDAARRAQPGWARLGGHGRARHLYALARLIQKNARLLAVLETLDNGKPIRESRDIDVPLVHRHFYYHAGMAQLMETELSGQVPLGVCGQIVPWNFPLLMLAWKVAPAIAMGNTVVLKPAEYTSLTALLFADICRMAGLPEGVVNVVTGDGAVGEMIVRHPGIDKIAFTGSTAVGRRIREMTAGSGKALTLELGGKSAYIVFDDADLDSAVEGLVDAIWFNQGQVCCAGSRLLVQEGVAERFYAKLTARMDKLRMGNPLDKSIDIGAMVDAVQVARIAEMVDASAAGHRHVADVAMPEDGAFYPPTLITGLAPSDPLMQEEIFGPVLVATTFRTHVEAVEVANNTRYGLAGSVWSENVNLALDVAPKLAAGVVWVNGTNMLDAAAGFGGVRESGFGREGGWEGLRAYTKASGKAKALKPVKGFAGNGGGAPGIDRTGKLYIEGRQVRPDGGYSRNIYGKTGKLLGQVPMANRKDLRNAVEAAQAASGWVKSSGHGRAQILYYMAENLSARADEFAVRINAMTGKRQGAKEVEASISRLFTYAAWADKYDGRVHGVPIRGVAMAMHQPTGIIGAFCADEAPLLGVISVIGPVMAMGNRCVVVTSELFPLVALEFVQVLETSDVPGGVVNVLTGSHADLAPHLAAHGSVDAVWSFSSSDISGEIERASAGNLKRTWVNNAHARDWMGAAGEGHEFLEAATEVQNIWIPYGE